MANKSSKPRSKKKKQRPGGVDPNEQRRQRLEQRRAQRAEEQRARERAAAREKWIRRGIYAALFLAAVWFFFLRTQGPSEFNGHPVEEFVMAGEGDHVTEPQTVAYDSTPPVSGAHWPTPGACGVLNQQIPNERQVHTLEHGAIGILYDPTLDPEDITALEDIVREYETHVFSAPYSGMETPIAVTSWGRMMRLETVDAPAIREYVDAFREKGPEEQPCPNSADAPFGSDTPAPGETPNASATITPGGGGNNGGGNNGGGGNGGGGNNGDEDN